MQEEIHNKLHTALYSLTPLASERDRIIGDMGETIWLESLEKMLLALPEDKRAHVVSLLNEDDFEGAIASMVDSTVDIDAIIVEVSTSVMEEVLTVVT